MLIKSSMAADVGQKTTYSEFLSNQINQPIAKSFHLSSRPNLDEIFLVAYHYAPAPTLLLLLPCSCPLHGGWYWPKKDRMRLLLHCSCHAPGLILACFHSCPAFVPAPLLLPPYSCCCHAPALPLPCYYSAAAALYLPCLCFCPALTHTLLLIY